MLQINETWDEFRSKCMHFEYCKPCQHPTAEPLIKCYDKKLCPRIYKKEKPVAAGWRNRLTGYSDYLIMHSTAYSDLLEDKEWLQAMKTIHPDIDILLSLEKAKRYWTSMEGWKKKLATKSKGVDFKATYQKALDMNWNHVRTGNKCSAHASEVQVNKSIQDLFNMNLE